ncbi:jg27880 [Pararge aegeria aegeria]|uniref:Jg27880 protein n=1 Tax=Pararge aegeria aegeria TaxID=348720 RepID=A0A8S4QPJ7_9NEOP|nr:jg27880 [Pararge aegeria aegeria]
MTVSSYRNEYNIGSHSVVVSKRAKGSIAKKAAAYLQAVKRSQGTKGPYFSVLLRNFDYYLRPFMKDIKRYRPFCCYRHGEQGRGKELGIFVKFNMACVVFT